MYILMKDWNPRRPDICRFTQGDCHVFAAALHRLTGWPIHAFDDYGEPILHAFVMTPDGQAADVMGIRPLQDLLEYWTWDTHSECDWRELRDCWGSDVFGPYSASRARVVAKRMLEHYGVL